MMKIDSTPISLLAAADLSTKTLLFGKFTAGGLNVCTVRGERADCIIGSHYKNTPAAGDAIDAYIERLPVVIAGEAFAAGIDLTTSAAGKAIAAGAGDVINAVSAEASGGDLAAVRVRPVSQRAAAQNVADAQTNAGVPVVYTRYVADHATQDLDVVLLDKVEFYDFVVQKRDADATAVANTVTVKNAANPISDAMSLNAKTDKAIVRAGSIDDAFSTVLAGGTLRLTQTKAGGDAAFFITMLGIKRA